MPAQPFNPTETTPGQARGEAQAQASQDAAGHTPSLPLRARGRSFIHRHRERFKYAIKMGLVAVLGYWTGVLSGLSSGFLVSLYAVVGMQLNVADSIESCLNRLGGTVIGAVMAYLAVLLFPHNPLSITLQLFFLLAVCGVMIHYQERYRMVAITVAILLVTGAAAGEDSLRVCLERVAEIVLGVAISFVVTTMIWPRRLADDVRQSVKNGYAESLEYYAKIVDCFINGEKVPPEISQAVYITLPGRVWKDKEKLNKTLRNEAPVYRADYVLVDRLLMTEDRIVESLKGILDAMSDMGPGKLAPALRESLLSLTQATEQALGYLSRWPSLDKAPDLRPALEKSIAEVRAARAERRYRHMAAEELERHMAVSNDLRTLARNLVQTLDWLSNYGNQASKIKPDAKAKP